MDKRYTQKKIKELMILIDSINSEEDKIELRFRRISADVLCSISFPLI